MNSPESKLAQSCYLKELIQKVRKLGIVVGKSIIKLADTVFNTSFISNIAIGHSSK